MTRQKPLDYVPIDVLIFDSPKMRRFCAMFTARRKWQCQVAVVRFLCWAGLNAPDGMLGKLSAKDIKSICDWPGESTELLDSLVLSNWLMQDQYDAISVVKWSYYGGKAMLKRRQWRDSKKSGRSKSEDLDDDVHRTSNECPPLKSKYKSKLKNSSKEELRGRLFKQGPRDFTQLDIDAEYSFSEIEGMLYGEGWHLQGYGGEKRVDNRVRLSDMGSQKGARLYRAAEVTRKSKRPNCTYFLSTLIGMRDDALNPTTEDVQKPNYRPRDHECTTEELVRSGRLPEPESNPEAPSRPSLDGKGQPQTDKSENVKLGTWTIADAF